MKMLALERIRAKHFTKAWGFIKTAEAIPVLFGIPLVSFLNEASSMVPGAEVGQAQHILHHGRAGYFVCSAATAISTVLLFFIGHPERRYNKPAATSTNSCNGSLISHCGGGGLGGPLAGSDCPDLLNRSFNSSARYGGGTLPHWYPNPYTPTKRCSTGGVGVYSSSVYPVQHQHPGQQQMPPAYNQNPNADQQHCKRTNGGAGTVAGSVAGGSRLHPPRLQKSLSFAFQTPPASILWSEPNHRHHNYFHPQQQQQYIPHQHHPQHAVNGVASCFYSRCSSR